MDLQQVGKVQGKWRALDCQIIPCWGRPSICNIGCLVIGLMGVLFCYNICYQGMCWYPKFQQDIQIYTLLLRALSTINMRIATCMDRFSMIYGQKTGTCDRHFLLFLTADGSKRVSETSPECLTCLKHVVRRRPAEHVMWWCPCPWTKDRGWRVLTRENNYKVVNQKGWQ